MRNFWIILILGASLSAAEPAFYPLQPPAEQKPIKPSRQEKLLQHFTPWEVPANAQLALSVRTKEEFVIPLYENGTTGYRWEVLSRQANTPAIQMTRRLFLLPESSKGMTGAGGLRLFFFKTGPSCGSAVLRFRYVRPWQKDQEPASQFTLFLTITEE